jgi:hypothetical protein
MPATIAPTSVTLTRDEVAALLDAVEMTRQLATLLKPAIPLLTELGDAIERLTAPRKVA